jgi:hypothetical protein
MPVLAWLTWVAMLTLLASAPAQQPAAPRWAEVRVTHLQCLELAPYILAHNHPIVRFRNLPLPQELEWSGHIKRGETVRPNIRVVFRDQILLRIEEYEILGRNQRLGEVEVKAGSQSYSRTVTLRDAGHFRLTYQVAPLRGPFFRVHLVDVSREPALDQDRFEERLLVRIDGLPWHHERPDPMLERLNKQQAAPPRGTVLPATSVVHLEVELNRKVKINEPTPFPPFARTQTPLTAQTTRWGDQPPGARVVTWKLGPNRWQVKFDVQPWPEK